MNLNHFDQDHLGEQHDYLLGSDEVGRGPLAGPVVAASVAVKRENIGAFTELASALGITDSKKLSEKKRTHILAALEINLERLRANQIYHHQLFSYSLGELSPQEIDQHNILKASMMAMDQSRQKLALGGRVMWLVDGNRAPAQATDFLEISCVVKGDQKSLCIALASIIAKSYRDLLMQKLGELYPGYGLESHAGYPTAIHREAIRSIGPSPVHRQSFKGVKEYVAHTKGKSL